MAERPRLTTMLMFAGEAERAMDLYLSLFEDGEVVAIERYGEGEEGPAGTVKHATARLAGQTLEFIDSPVEHGFTFTPAASLCVECESAAEVDELFARLGEGGSALMPLGEYPFAGRYGWVADRFGVSWQLRFRG